MKRFIKQSMKSLSTLKFSDSTLRIIKILNYGVIVSRETFLLGYFMTSKWTIVLKSKVIFFLMGLFFFSFHGTGDWSQDLAHAGQALYPWGTSLTRGTYFKDTVNAMVDRIFHHSVPLSKVTFSPWGILLEAYLTKNLLFKRKIPYNSWFVFFDISVFQPLQYYV